QRVFPWNEKLPRNRLGLAAWLFDPQHPLTARVYINRMWQGHFGNGIVQTVDDFGTQGTNPTHPELLDYLAVEFVRSGWDMRHMHKLMVMSATYRQGSERHLDGAGDAPPRPAGFQRPPRGAGEGSTQLPLGARPALPHARRDHPRQCAQGL